MPLEDTVDGDWTYWDSGKPRDWSAQTTPVESAQFSDLPPESPQVEMAEVEAEPETAQAQPSAPSESNL